jgi:hypothetical protein
MITNFSLDSYTISNTRSVHEDTNYCTVSITVGTNPAITKTQAMGDQNNGTFKVGLGISADLPATPVPVVFSYLILNNGHGSASDVEKGIQAALSALGSAGAKAASSAVGGAIGSALGAALGTAVVPILGTAIGALAGWVTGEVGTILFANCDGVVATGIRIFTSTDLINQTANGHKLSETTSHPGTDSATGCGSNSKYSTVDSISTIASVTPVINLNGKWASGGAPGPIIAVSGNAISVDMSAYHRPTAQGTILDSTDITVTFPDDKTYTAKLQAPNTIAWSNNSTWTKVATVTSTHVVNVRTLTTASS